MTDFARRDTLKLGGLALGGLGAAQVIGMGKASASPLLSPPEGDLQSSRSKVVLLSGTGKDHTVDWEFQCTKGSNSGFWTTIPVPSNWELQGFGTYTYGQLSPGEQGQYRYSFTTPASWTNRRVFLVFEGSMTDTEVWVNGTSAGPVHQGAFYRFGYDVTDLLRFGDTNMLEVTVSKDSSNSTINGAERLADYWVFGGIYRPVYLEARPQQFIDRLAINAQADGSFAVDVYLDGITDADTLTARITGPVNDPSQSQAVGQPFSAPIPAGPDKTTLTTSIAHPQLWTAETPNLYQVEIRLLKGATEIHQVTETFGFRTIEFRAGDGIYVNGTKVILRGVNRHSFWPDSGRTTSSNLSRSDILLMKKMNVNAVRMSHYPPDQHFLDYADALGLYVLDELGGWQHAYDTPTASRLVQEMVVRDVNHPSIIFWDNGNEGGWNTAVDGDFALYDPQNRHVNHPGGGNFNSLLDRHYPTYSQTAADLDASAVVLPTEFLHALYDGGGGSGLNDTWQLMTSKPLGAGGFIWDFVDGGVVRTDEYGRVDSNGNKDADGVTGPYRQPEGSFFTIKDIWSPIQLANPAYFEASFPAGFDGTVEIANHHHFTNTGQCQFTWELIQFKDPSNGSAGHSVVQAGQVKGPDIPPGSSGALHLEIPASQWKKADALSLTAVDPAGQQVSTWVWTINKATDYRARIVTTGQGNATATEDAAGVTMTAAGTEITISKSSGQLVNVRQGGRTISFANGPVPAAGTATLTQLTHGQDGNAYVVHADYTGDMDYCTWRLLGSGWLQLEYQYNLSGEYDFFGVNFDYPEEMVTGIKWLGRGPYRVYKNRMRGPVTDVWEKNYNNTATGSDLWEYPEFKGYYAKTNWMSLQTAEGTITAVADDEDAFLRLYTPRNGPSPQTAVAPYPAGDISFLDAIPAMGNKFHRADQEGPEGQQNVATGTYRRTFYLAFRSSPGSEPLVTGVNPGTLAAIRPAEVGRTYYVDRDFVVLSLPAALTGGTMIPGANDDKAVNQPADYLTFDLTNDATVYTAFDARGEGSWWPSWLATDGFTQTGMRITTTDTDTTFVVFKKQAKAGRVVLGPNSATGAAASYFTIVTN